MRIKILIILLLAAQYPASADTLTVGPSVGAGYDYSSIQAAMDAASNGDTVLVTRGVYQENLTISGKIITLASNYINSKDEDDILQTIVDGGGAGSILEIRNVTTDTVVTGLTFQNSPDGILPYSKFSLLHCRITGCDDGIDYESNSGGICMHNLFEYNNDDGIDLDQDVDIEIANNIIRYNKDDGIEIRLHPYTGSTLTNNIHDNIIIGNGADGIQLIDYDDLSDRVFYIENNIIANSNQAGIGCMDKGETREDYRAASIPEPVYMINNTFCNNLYGITGGDNMVVKNNIFAETDLIALKKVDGSSSITYNAFWQNGTDFSNTSPGVGNHLNINPLFADAANGDYHLQSQAGRWDPNLSDWIVDVNTSPCIDAGDPNSDWMGEIWPHGERINMGAYGGTLQASMSTKPEAMTLPHVAYIHEHDVEAAKSFQSLVLCYGCSATLIGLAGAGATPLDSYDLIIVGNDTGFARDWGDPNSVESVAAIESSSRPVLGLGEGGYAFFGKLGLEIGYPNGGHTNRNSIAVIDPNNPLFSVPYSVDIPEDQMLQLYTESNNVGLHLQPVPETVTVLGAEVFGESYYPLALEHDRYMLWGFTESPLKMTEEGKRLFINVVIRASNKAWGN